MKRVLNSSKEMLAFIPEGEEAYNHLQSAIRYLEKARELYSPEQSVYDVIDEAVVASKRAAATVKDQSVFYDE